MITMRPPGPGKPRGAGPQCRLSRALARGRPPAALATDIYLTYDNSLSNT